MQIVDAWVLKIRYRFDVYRLLLLILLCGCGHGGNSNESPVVDTRCPIIVSNTLPVGISFIHALQPEASAQIAALQDLLLDTCLKRLAVNILTDGSFTWSEERLIQIVDDLSNKRDLSLILYLYNGASQRRWKNSAVKGFATHVEPGKFRTRILYDAGLREEFRANVRKLSFAVNYAQALGVHVYFVVGLEDNLTKKEALEMQKLANEAIDPLEVSWIRNPCGPACYAGNDDDTTGFLRERHTDVPSFSTAGGVIINDGYDVEFERAMRLMEVSQSQGNIFLHWDSARQGLTSGTYPAPNKRHYAIPTEFQKSELIKLLQRSK